MTQEALREDIRARLTAAGCAAAGFARAEKVDPDYIHAMRGWLDKGHNASMDYLSRNQSLRFDPREILQDAQTVISVAVPYLPAAKRPENAPQVALYASGKDYHKQIVKMLRPVCRHITGISDAVTRICVDSAPVAERYWALKAGIGIRGLNGTLILPPYGSYVFLAEILTTLSLPPDTPSTDQCCGCGRCVRECPGRAILHDGTIDARRCLSYLTIEHRGEYSPEQHIILNSKAGRNTIYGCDICQKVCPHNVDAMASGIEAFAPTPCWLSLDTATIAEASEEQWRRMTQGSAMRRADFATLKSRISRK